jgi:hypothetical protein
VKRRCIQPLITTPAVLLISDSIPVMWKLLGVIKMTVMAPGTSLRLDLPSNIYLAARRLQIVYQPTDAMGAGSCSREPERCSIPMTAASRAMLD